jgi:hypothetical protein
MIEHVGPDRLISFIGWQRINRLHIMMEELTREIYHPRPVHESRIVAPDKSEVFVIMSTLKKWGLDPIDS